LAATVVRLTAAQVYVITGV